MANLHAHGTFSPVTTTPRGKRTVGAKFIVKAKPNMTSDGFIQKFKCRICAKGFPEIAGIDFQETFAPTKNSTSILTILAITAQHQLYLRQIDWIAAYLNGVMEHEVYMKMPDGTTRQMLKAFYGTRQGAERWHAPLLQAFINL